MSIYVQSCPGRSGWQWLKQGLTHLRQRPGELFLLGNSYLFLVLVLGVFIPWLGPLLLVTLGPTLNFGTMTIGQRLGQGQNVSPIHLFAAFGPTHRHRLRPLLILSLVYTVLFELAKLLCDSWVGAAPRLDKVANPSQIDPVLIQEITHYAVRYMLASAVTTVPIIVLFWFAPALLIWQNMSPAQALFSSLLAAWRNKSAFCVYGVAWLAMAALLMTLPTGALRIANAPTAVVGSVQMLALALVLAASMASFYASFSSVFAPKAERTNPWINHDQAH